MARYEFEFGTTEAELANALGLPEGSVVFTLDWPTLIVDTPTLTPGQEKGLDSFMNANAPRSSAIEINEQTSTSYTLVLADGGKLVRLTNASAITLTIPPASSVDFPIGTQIMLQQGGAGQVTIAAGSGVTLNAASSEVVTVAQYSVAGVMKTASDTWVALGDLTTA